ncbi:Permease of the drug/metabolite transporter (DMT) superfamily [Carboxydocella sporoproducens DSM 16521]|uniref:Permease of the drug/metabolite transporter (DMT) superfamily n=2 Tax=Carboxydocella TaxID=178898 RepID=A0A1T4M6V9_9FIRM|nr:MULTISPECIES: EamA family transporter [Carboxydocella]AVX21018.1 Permease of the drug/metabolite transporter (DMT) superfamily [Carboxydocella thermautotrophica]SJZ62739.1 Permease of the drug/metabolite transporter (DMT) superfamily [Carboxydocella sporoproducens DSM 16521]
MDKLTPAQMWQACVKSMLYGWTRLGGAPRPTVEQWKYAVIVGSLLLLGGNGGVVWGEQQVPSGIAALIIATVPLWMALIAWATGARPRPQPLEWLGLILGFTGILWLISPSLASVSGAINSYYLIVVLAAISWAWGSIYSRKANWPDSAWLAIGMQMLAGGLACLGASILLGEAGRLDLNEVTMQSWLAFGYLVLFGSLVGYSAYIWLLKNADPLWVSTYAYVNPVVAVLLGWFWAGEELNSSKLTGAVLVLAAVVLISIERNRKKTVKSV